MISLSLLLLLPLLFCKGVGITEPHHATIHLGTTREGSAAAPSPVIPRSPRVTDEGVIVIDTIMTESTPPWFKLQSPHEDVSCSHPTLSLRCMAPSPGPCHNNVLELPATHRASTLDDEDASPRRVIITAPAAQSSSSPTRAASTRPHDRICARPAAVARNLEIDSGSANDPCSAQS